ncbi:DUF6328 family protein [Streptomyces fulvorobeus]|uniref:Integral membrane protein n=1 Tax=Streptomyces fulvorobeus TaxID=284028 RepID=A0A7J0C331_9ACTN|nr:DUF6328 family protein [Streptomyces fulvorobeus]NYE40608.1 hypothetical protein [Streptomyces fulvorobeus]GFM96902.1 hypothetical protein Sfulv_17130 [Streptomyces fulvorobeus]
MADLQKSDDRQPAGNDSHEPSVGRDETAAERADRRWVELLQEVRVAQTGVQILLAFLLSVAFTPRFTELGSTDRTIYVITIVLGAAATGALIAPVSFHRFVSGQQMKPQAVEWASRMTVTGLLLLLCTIMCALLLILRVVLEHSAALWVVSGVFLWFLGCWVVLPAWARWSK